MMMEEHEHDNEVSYVVQDPGNPSSSSLTGGSDVSRGRRHKSYGKLIIGRPIGESSVDDDDYDDPVGLEAFVKAEDVIARVVGDLDEAQELCGHRSTVFEAQNNNNNNKDDDDLDQQQQQQRHYLKAKDQLTNESRQFVTASKLFVKSATESEGQLVECLTHCVQMVERIGKLSGEVAGLTPTPLQTQSLLAKVRDVVDTYLQTVQAAGNAVGKDMNDPSMGTLMKKATSLASVLTTLMRSLRVFN